MASVHHCSFIAPALPAAVAAAAGTRCSAASSAVTRSPSPTRSRPYSSSPSPPPANHPATTSASRARRHPTAAAKRVRGVSNLSRKYRDAANIDMDETVLIGDTGPSSSSLSGIKRSSKDSGTETGSSPQNSSARIKGNNVANNIIEKLQQQQQQAPEDVDTDILSLAALSLLTGTQERQRRERQHGKLRDHLKKYHVDKGKQPTVPSYSRFPSTWYDAVDQMCSSVTYAFAQGFDRLCVDLAPPSTFPAMQCDSFGVSVSEDNLPPSDSTHVTDAVSRLITHLLVAAELPTKRGRASVRTHRRDDTDINSNGTRSNSGSGAATPVSPRQKALRENLTPGCVLVLFNSESDMESYASLLPAAVGGRRVTPGVLGCVDCSAFVGNLIIVIDATNRCGNPSHIETVEHVHYSNFNRRNWVVLLNADLVSLTNHTACEQKPPLFLADYCVAFHANPVAYPSATGLGKGALLRTYPRKWELFLEREGRKGLRMVSELKQRPSADRMQCELWWRIERDVVDSNNTIG